MILKQIRDIKLKNLLSCSCLVFIFELIDMLVYSRAMLHNSGENADLMNISTILYIYPTIISMIGYNIFTKIESGIVSSTIVENFPYFSRISKNIESNTETFEEYISNCLMIFMFATFLFAISSIILSRTNVGHWIILTPKAIIYGVFIYIGVIQLPIGYGQLVSDKPDMKYIGMYICAILLVFITLFFQRKFPSAFIVVPGCLFTALFIFYIFSFISLGKQPIEPLKGTGWLPQTENTIINPSLIFRLFSFKDLNFHLIIENQKNILQVVFFSLIHVIYNLPSFSMITGIKMNYTNSVAAQGFTNFFTFLPTYFISIYSAQFYSCGGVSRIYGFLAAFPLLFAAIYGNIIYGFVPKFILCTPPFFIGLSMIIDTLYLAYKEAGKFDLMNMLIISIFIICTSEIVIGIVFGLLLHALMFVFLGSRNNQKDEIVNEIDLLEQKQIKIITVDFPLCFLTCTEFTQQVSKVNPENGILVINLSECRFVDWNGSSSLFDLVENFDGNIVIYGHPYNLNLNRFKKKNIKITTDKVICIQCVLRFVDEMEKGI